MEKGSADESQSLAREASSPTFHLCDQEEHPQVPSSHEKSLTGREVTDRDVVKSTTHLLGPDAGFLGGAAQGNAEATKDVTDNTFHPEASWRWGARRRHKLRSISSNASRHLHRNRGKEGQSAKAVEYKETPTTTTAVSTLGHPRARHNSAIPRYEATRPETSDTIEKAAALSPDSGSPHGGSASHTARQQTPELCPAVASRSRNHSKRRSISASTLKKRARSKKAAHSPPLLDEATPPLGYFDDDNPAVLDECATSACQNLMTPLSTAGKGVWSTHALDKMSPAPGDLPPALGPTLPNAQPNVTDVHLASPTAGEMSPEPFSATAASPFVPGSVCSSPQGIVAPQAAPTQPAPAFPRPSRLSRRVPYPSESHASPPLITRDTSLPSAVPQGQGQLSDVLTPIASEGSSAAGPPQPIPGETSPVIDSKVPSPAANLSGAESMMLPQGNKQDHLKSRSQTETVQSRRKTTSVRFGATTLWEVTVASASRLTGSPVACGICCMILTATLVSVALVFLTSRTRPTYIKECTSAVCARATSSLWALMEDTVDPCQDFYSHVCRRWDNITGGRLRYLDHSVQQIARRVNQSLHDADELGGASHATRGVAQFYKLCLRFVTSSDRAISRTQIMRSFGAENRDRLLTLTNFSDVVATLTDLSLSRGLNTVFGVKLVRRAGVTALNVFPGKTLAETVSPPSAAAWSGYLVKLLAEVVAAHPSENLDVDSVQNVDETVRQLLAFPDVSDIVWEQVDSDKLNFLGEATIANAWLAAVNSHLPADDKLGTKSKVLITNYKTVRNVLQFLGSLADYGVTYLYLHLLLEVFRFDYVRSLQDRGAVDLVRECLQASQEAMWHTRNVFTTNIFGSRSKGVRESANVLRLVTEATSSGFANWLSWMGEAMRSRAQNMLSTLSLHVHDWYAWNDTSDAIAERAMSLISGARAADFPSIYVRLKEEQHRAFLMSTRAISDADDRLHVLETDVRHEGGSNEVVVPASLRVEPMLYTEDVPFAFAAGTLAVLVATGLYRAAIPGIPSSMRHPQERSVMNKFEDCVEKLADDVLNISLPAHKDAPFNGHSLPAHIFWMLAARTAHEALRLATLSFKRAVNWPSYWKKSQRTFFRRFCLLTCGSGDEDNGQTSVTQRVLCLLPVSSMPEFFNVFECHNRSTALRYTTCILDRELLLD